MSFRISFVAAVASTALLGCSVSTGSVRSHDTTHASTVQTTPVSAVTIVRGACYGTCPQYSLTVAADGGVIFVGYDNVAARGLMRDHIDPAAAQALISRFHTAGFAGLEDSYVPGQAWCGLAGSDAPEDQIILVTADRQKKVTHYRGCSDAPAVLKELKDAVDAAAGSSRWMPR